MSKPQEVQHGTQPSGTDAEVQHGTQPLAAETVNVNIGPGQHEEDGDAGDPGIVADYQGGDPVPEPEPEDEPEADVASTDDTAPPAETDE